MIGKFYYLIRVFNEYTSLRSVKITNKSAPNKDFRNFDIRFSKTFFRNNENVPSRNLLFIVSMKRNNM